MLSLVSLLLSSQNAWAESGHDEAHHSYHKNILGVFAGITGKAHRGKAPTLAIEYERRLNEKFGVGFTLERAFGDAEFNVYVAGAGYHSGLWKFFVGAGIEDSDHHHGNETLFRAGVERAFEVGSLEIAPQLSVDFVDGDTVVIFGAVFAKGF